MFSANFNIVLGDYNMSAFEVIINRTFSVMIEASDRETACRASEYYLGYSDDSKDDFTPQYQFCIHRIMMTENNAVASRLISPETEENENR